MQVAKIISSNSHIDYVGRVIDTLDTEYPPTAEDYGFAQFVSLPTKDSANIIGVIYDSILVNPEYSNYGPRLSPKPDLTTFSPDYLNEQGVLIGILLLGSIDESGKILHGVPRRVVPAGQEIVKVDAGEMRKFHTDANECLQIHYYSQIVAHAGLFAAPLLEAIIGQLHLDCTDEDRKRLNVLKQAITWQRTVGGMRL